MSVRILGVDPGLTRCGLGVVEALPGRKVRLVAVDVVRTPSDLALEQRLLLMAEAFESWIGEHRPHAVAVERVFAQHNVRTVMGTAQAAGIALERAAARGLTVGLHTPSEVKAAVTAVAEGLDVTGVLAVELFETDDERILINELAMRPHNSGHWSIEGSTTSQFEQHLRAVLDLPLGATGTVAPWTVMVNVLGGPADGDLARPRRRALGEHPDVAVHLYGKAPRPGRTIGHVTALGTDLDDVAYRARAAAAAFG